jgi:DNA-binding NarL/FixJ family response regulator
MQPQPLCIHVVLADDHNIVRAALRALLNSIPGINVVAEASDGRELLALLDSVLPDIVITDISMPGVDGITAIEKIRERHPKVRVMVLSMHDSPDIVRRSVRAGACAYVRKDAPDFELQSAIHAVMSTGGYFSTNVAKILLEPGESTVEEELTSRQIQILRLIAHGKSTKEIAHSLGLSPKTVDVHRARIMDRLGIRDVASLTLYAVRKGLLKL